MREWSRTSTDDSDGTRFIDKVGSNFHTNKRSADNNDLALIQAYKERELKTY